MKNKFAHLALFTSKINRQHVQLILAILALAMLAIGVGAPEGSGSIPPH